MLLNGKGFERAPFILTIKDFKMNKKIYSQQDLENTATELRRVHTFELFIFISITLLFSFVAGCLVGVTI